MTVMGATAADWKARAPQTPSPTPSPQAGGSGRRPFTGGPSPTAMDNHVASSGDRYVNVNNMTAADANSNMQIQKWMNNMGSGRPPTPPGGSPSGGYGRGGGGGGGMPAIDNDNLMALLGRTPQHNIRPEQYQWEDYKNPTWNAPEYFDFNGEMYDQMGQGIAEGAARDRKRGMGAYGDARFEAEQYQNPFANRGYATNQPMDQAMQRMMRANGVSADPTEIARGVQADQAFGLTQRNLAGVADQRQAAEMRALGGDERRFNETLDSRASTMQFQNDMARSQAMSQYEQNKFKYGADIARQMFEDEQATGMYNNQGRNTMGQQNTQQNNAVTQANTQLENDYNSGNIQVLLELMRNGQLPKDFDFAKFTNWSPTQTALGIRAGGGGPQ